MIFFFHLTLPGLLRKELQRNSPGSVERPPFVQPSDVNPSASDQKALSLPSFSVTQTLVNLLAERTGKRERLA